MELNYELNLRDYWVILLKRRWLILIVFFIFALATVIYTSMQKPIYKASVLLKVEVFPTIPSASIYPQTPYAGRDSQFMLSDYAKYLSSRPIIELAAKELGWIKEGYSSRQKEQIVSKIASWVSTEEISESFMIRLDVQSGDPDKATAIANKIAEVFKRVNSDQKNEQKRNVRIFIEQRLKDIALKLKVQDDKLRVLTTQGNVSGSAVNITQQIAEVETKLADLTGRYTELHPEVRNLKRERNELRAKLRSLPNEEFEYGAVKRDKAINETLYNQLKQKLQEAQIKEADKIDNIVIISPAFLPREPFFPNKRLNYSMGCLLGIAWGLIGAFLTEQLDTSIGKIEDVENFIKVGVLGVIPYCSEQGKEGKDKRIKRWGIPFKNDKAKEILNPIIMFQLKNSSNGSLFLEAFSLLSVNLQVLFGKGERIKNKIIMVTSCKSGEGKTTTASTLGFVMAQIGYKVLVIDADLRRPHIHKSFSLGEKGNGLTEVLTGKIGYDRAIKTATDILLGSSGVDKIVEMPWLNNLNILTTGSTLPNPVNIFNSDKLEESLAYFKSKYDVVLIDTSPVLAVSEVSVLLSKTDGVLLVYKAGSTSRLALRRAKIQIETVKGKGSLSGVILNNVTPEISMGTYYYYYNKNYYSAQNKGFPVQT